MIYPVDSVILLNNPEQPGQVNYVVYEWQAHDNKSYRTLIPSFHGSRMERLGLCSLSSAHVCYCHMTVSVYAQLRRSLVGHFTASMYNQCTKFSLHFCVYFISFYGGR